MNNDIKLKNAMLFLQPLIDFIISIMEKGYSPEMIREFIEIGIEIKNKKEIFKNERNNDEKINM